MFQLCVGWITSIKITVNTPYQWIGGRILPPTLMASAPSPAYHGHRILQEVLLQDADSKIVPGAMANEGERQLRGCFGADPVDLPED